MKAIEILEKTYKLPVRSAVQTMQRVGEWSLSDKQWHDITKVLRDDKSSNVSALTGPHEQEYATKYFIQNIVKQYVNGETKFDIDLLYVKSVDEAKKYIVNNPWVWAVAEDAPPKLNEDGSPAMKKGDKKLLAKEVYEANKGKEMTRKQWIELLVAEVGLTPAGASTYYANLKKGVY